MGIIEDGHQRKLEGMRAEQRLEEAKAAAALKLAQRFAAEAELMRAEEPVKLARIEADAADRIDERRVAAEVDSEARMVGLKLAMIVGGAAALCTLFASMAASAP